MADGFQHGFSKLQAHHVYNEERRRQKGAKVIAVLRDCLGSLENLSHLDVGCSTGFMTKLYSVSFKQSLGIDIDNEAVAFAQQTHGSDTVTFKVADAGNCGLPSASFDVVTCTHIYEHVPDSVAMMREIHRVLKPGGICLFAAGNRFKFMEEHYRLPLLSAIPKCLGHYYVRIFGRASFYYENHLSYWGLRKLVRDFELIDYTVRVIEEPERFAATDMIEPGSFKQKVAIAVIRACYWICPTYIWVLRKK